jgi:hypothetical protein
MAYPADLIELGDEVSVGLPGGAKIITRVEWLSEHGAWFKDPSQGDRVRQLGWPLADLTVLGRSRRGSWG